MNLKLRTVKNTWVEDYNHHFNKINAAGDKMLVKIIILKRTTKIILEEYKFWWSKLLYSNYDAMAYWDFLLYLKVFLLK